MGTLKLNKKTTNANIQAAETDEIAKTQKQAVLKNEKAVDNAVLEPQLCELAKQDEGFVEEIKDLRTENTTSYRRNDRTCRKVISATPVRYCDANGELKTIKNRLIDNGTEIVNEENSFKVKFNKDKSNGKIFDLQKGDKILTLSAGGTSKAQGHVCGCTCELCVDAENSVTAKTDDGAEIQYVSLNDRIKENIIVKERKDSYEYDFTLDIGDLTVEEGANNKLLLKDAATGETEFVIPAPYMYDANNKRSDKVSYEIDVNDSSLAIKVIADTEFINAEDTMLPVTIDPQIVVANYSQMDFETEFLYSSGRTQIINDALLVGKDINGTVINGKVTVKSSSGVNGIVLRKYLKFINMHPSDGHFYVNGKKFPADKLYYEIDYSGDVYEFTNDENNEPGQWCQFFVYGDDAPVIIIEYIARDNDNDLLYEHGVTPSIKQLDYCDKAKAYLYLKDGELATTFTSFNSDDFVLPLNITHVHKPGFEESEFGFNWRLNISKKLKAVKINNKSETRYIYTDELGDKYAFSEEYYYFKDGRRIYVNKNTVTINANGELTHIGHKVYKHQSCNGYTLLPSIDGFRHSDFVEQRQQQQIQLEDYVTQMEPILRNYVRVDSENGNIDWEFYTLNKENYLSLFNQVNKYTDIVIMPKNEALQLQSLYKQLKEFESQKNTAQENYNNRKKWIEDNKSTGLREAVLKEEKQLLEAIAEAESNVNFVKSQIEYIKEHAQKNFDMVESMFVSYFIKKDELDLLLKQTPVNYVKDKNGIISGFNSDGNLVLLCDDYGNYVNIVYNVFDEISEIYDSKNTVLRFDYKDDLLQCITNGNGKTVRYGYDGNKLISATYADGSVLNFKYSNEKFGSVESSDGIQWKTSFEKSKFSRLLIKRLQPANGTVSDMKVTYTNDGTILTFEDGAYECYAFDNCLRLSRYGKKDAFNHSESTVYTYGYNYGKTVTAKTSSNITNKISKEISQYNEIDLLVLKTVDWQFVSDTVKVKTETLYEYDLNNILIKEIATKYTDVSGNISEVKHITNYSYNVYGNLTLTESYIEGEELTTGKSYEQRVYNENGNVVKTINWNSLDSSSKFYSESDIAENGQVLAERDDTGEVCAEYEYENGTKIVNSVKNANGGKIAYGREPNSGKLISVTQSTESGEANCNDIVYQNGLPVEVKSGNTTIKYYYEDPKCRKTQVYVNGKKQTEYSYQDPKKENEDSDYAEKHSCTVFADEGKTYKFVYQCQGTLDEDDYLDKHETYTVGKTELWAKDYDYTGHLTDLTYKDEDTKKVKYEYDEFNRTTQVQTSAEIAEGETQTVLTENFTYNELGELSKKTYAGAVTQTYSYTYKPNAARGLAYIAFGSYKFKPLSDVNGRNTGNEIYSGNNKVAGEYISYRKVGDHATNMPATMWFASGENIKDSIKYAYDKCGNIAEIRANGHVAAKFTYDSLNRLVREDNKVLNKTVIFNYDACGNITERCEYAYTNKSGEQLEELECVHSEYRYNGDVLVGYNGEEFTYNNLGCPTTYRNKTLQWQYGTQLVNFNGTTFTYDGLGRRSKKNDIEFTYDNDNKLIKQSNGLEFVYDHAGVAGFIYEGEQYFYRKDVQGNVIAILDNTGAVVVNYIYDAWGNHAVVDNSGEDITSGIGALNPFRYRGYYYDTETGLYYLQTRYYDPELCRFISQDSVDYADPEKINGINLYAYCGNNPVMGYDPTGTTEWWEWLLAILGIGLLVAVAVGLTVLSWGATPLLGAAYELGASIVGGMAISATMSLNAQYQTGNLNWGTLFVDTIVGGISGFISFGVGKIFSAFGFNIGLYLNQMSINGLVVGKVFTNFIIPNTFKYVGGIIGGIIGGSFVDKYVNMFLGKDDSLVQRLLNNAQGTFWSEFLGFLLDL